MPTRIIYKRRKEKERRLAKLLLIATAVLAIGGAGIAACFTAIGHVDAVQRSEMPEFSWKKWYQRGGEFDWDAQEVGSIIIRIVATARKWAVAYVTAALPVGVALNDRNSRRRCGIPVHRRA